MFVIDTIAIRVNWPLLEHASFDDWKLTRFERERSILHSTESADLNREFQATHRLFGIYIRGRANEITLLKVSLPRIIHGDNAYLISNQEQLNEALESLFDFVGEIADTSRGIEHFTRVDLVWQFRHDPASLIRAHQHCIFPRCRKESQTFGRRSAAWKYSGMRLVMYDKQLKRCGTSGDITRVEIQLTKKKLHLQLGHQGEKVNELNFNSCYRVFRETLITFAPTVEVNTPRDIYEGLALLEQRDTEHGLASPTELLLSTMPSRTARDWRKKITASRIIGFSTDEPGKFEGWHGENLLMIVDEAKSVPDSIFEAIERCQPTRLLVMSSPGGRQGFLYEAFTKRRKFFRHHTITAHQCPHIARSWIQEQIEKYGELHPLVRSMIFAEFMDAGEESTAVNVTQLEQCTENPPAFVSGKICPATITNGWRRQLKLTPGDNYQPGSIFRGRNRWFSRREPRREAEPTGG